jgi:two-component system LytT family response regulator
MALRIAIIEDEPATARNLKYLLEEADASIEVLALLGGVGESVEWLRKNEGKYDLLFMDIRLNDGLSLEIFDQLAITIPVIFVTAYHDYALQAFKANGIDYILKPIDEQELRRSLDRFKQLTHHDDGGVSRLLALAESLRAPHLAYKHSFLVHFRDKLIPLAIGEVCWFRSSSETTFAHTADGRKLIVEFTLEQLQEQLDPKAFFRVNRQFIVARRAIHEIEFYFNGRLLVKTHPAAEEQMLVSKAKAPEFKEWMNS